METTTGFRPCGTGLTLRLVAGLEPGEMREALAECWGVTGDMGDMGLPVASLEPREGTLRRGETRHGDTVRTGTEGPAGAPGASRRMSEEEGPETKGAVTCKPGFEADKWGAAGPGLEPSRLLVDAPLWCLGETLRRGAWDPLRVKEPAGVWDTGRENCMAGTWETGRVGCATGLRGT